MFDAPFTGAPSCVHGPRQRLDGRTTLRRRAWPVLTVGLLVAAGCGRVHQPAEAPVAPKQATQPPAAPSPPAPTPSSGTESGRATVVCPDDARSAVKVVDERHCEVPRAVFFGDGPGCVSAMPRLTPQSEGGRVIGFRYDGVGQKSVYALCGIRSGDTWTKVNAVPLSSPDDILRSYEALRRAPELTISLLRDGQHRDVKVVLR